MRPLEGGKISGRQFMAMLVVLRLVPTTLVFSTISSAKHVQDAWIAAVLGTVIAIPLVVLITKLALKFPEKTIIEYSQILLGPVAGRLVGGLLVLSFLEVAANTGRGLGEAYAVAIMPETPILVFAIMTAIMSSLAARAGLEVAVRLGEDAFYIIMFVIAMICVLPYNTMRFENLRPYLVWGFSSLIPPLLADLGFYGQFTIIGMIVPYLDRPREATKYAVAAVIISGVTIAVLCVALVSAFGPVANSWTMPAFSLSRMISLGDFFERTEAAVMGAWTMSTGIKGAAFLWAAAVGTGQLFGLESFEPLAYPLGAIAVAFGVLHFDSMVDLDDFLAKAGAAFYLVLALAVLAILYAAAAGKGSAYRARRGQR